MVLDSSSGAAEALPVAVILGAKLRPRDSGREKRRVYACYFLIAFEVFYKR